MRLASHLTAVLVAAFVIASNVGCQSDPRMKETEKAVDSFNATKAAVANAQKQVDDVLVSMNNLSSARDLVAETKIFNSKVDDLRASAEKAKKRADEMRANQAVFIQKWEDEMATINDPTLKSTLEERRKAVRDNFDEVRASGQAVKEAYGPFMTQLGEIQKALAIDLTPKTVAAIRPAMDKANASGKTLKTNLAALQADLERIQAGLSASGAKES